MRSKRVVGPVNFHVDQFIYEFGSTSVFLHIILLFYVKYFMNERLSSTHAIKFVL